MRFPFLADAALSLVAPSRPAISVQLESRGQVPEQVPERTPATQTETGRVLESRTAARTTRPSPRLVSSCLQSPPIAPVLSSPWFANTAVARACSSKFAPSSPRKYDVRGEVSAPVPAPPGVNGILLTCNRDRYVTGGRPGVQRRTRLQGCRYRLISSYAA